MADQPHAFTKAGARRIVDAVRTVERGAPPLASDTKDRSGRGAPVWAKIMSSTGSGPWAYSMRVMVGGDTTGTGLKEYSATEWPGYNTAETLTNAGYVNANVTGILAIPNDSIVLCTWVARNGEMVLVFRERNEPTCST